MSKFAFFYWSASARIGRGLFYFPLEVVKVLEKQEVIGVCVIGVVDSKNELPPNEQYKGYSTFVRLAGGAMTLRANGRAADCPADGELCIFQLERSRSGSTPRIMAWGWIGSLVPDNVDVQWVKSLGAGGPSSGGGIKREAVSANGAKG